MKAMSDVIVSWAQSDSFSTGDRRMIKIFQLQWNRSMIALCWQSFLYQTKSVIAVIMAGPPDEAFQFQHSWEDLTIKSNSGPFQKHFPPRGIRNNFVTAPAPHFQTSFVPDFRISDNKKTQQQQHNPNAHTIIQGKSLQLLQMIEC